MFKGLIKSKSSVLQNIVDRDNIVRRASSIVAPADFDICYIGRLVYQKNPERLIRIIRLIADELPDVRVAIVGTGDLVDKVRSLVNELHLEKNIEIFGYQDNPLGILKASKVMLMTSRFEGTPMCALESMALGVPIVSTPTDGLRNLVDSGVNGFLSDDDFQLADHVKAIIKDWTLREKLSVNCSKALDLKISVAEYKAEILRQYRAAVTGARTR